MALEIKQSLRLSQQLVMTPQLQQAIKLLQLNRMELQEVVTQEMMENPILEEVPDSSEGENQVSLDASEGDTPPPPEEGADPFSKIKPQQEQLVSGKDEFNWE